MIQAKIVLGTD